MKLSTSTIRKLYLGLYEINQVYLGSTLVYDNSTPLASWFVSQSPQVQPTEYQVTSDSLGGLWFNVLPVQES